jgi:hypothetical protein
MGGVTERGLALLDQNLRVHPVNPVDPVEKCFFFVETAY